MFLTEEQSLFTSNFGDRINLQALAGTGKTESVVYRIIERKRFSNDKPILCLCFTNAAVFQLQERLIEKQVDMVSVYTIDSFVSKILNPYGIKLSDGKSQMEAALNRRGLPTTSSTVKSLLKLSQFLNIGGIEFDEVIPGVPASEAFDVLKDYDDIKKEFKIVDFSDAVILATEVIKSKSLMSVFSEIIVDEAQDLNASQNVFIDTLAGKNTSVVYVGDSNQSIYSFAGVKVEHNQLFTKDWDTLSLTTSYRSSKSVVDTVNSVLNTQDNKKPLVGFKDDVGSYDISEKKDFSNWIDSQVGSIAVLSNTKYALREFVRETENKGLNSWKSWVDDKSDVYSNGNDIVFSSIHKSKGLEFDNVAVVDIADIGFRGTDGLRLMYVAVSRARNNLTVIPQEDSILPEFLNI